MLTPKISVLVVNFQADAHIRRFEKTFSGLSDIELIVVDNTERNRGYSEGLNTAAREARGEVLLCLNPDVELTVADVRVLAQKLHDHPEVAVVGPQICRPSGELEISCSALPGPFTGALLWSFLGQWPVFRLIHRWYRLSGFDHRSERRVPSVGGSCFAVRTTDWEALGGLDQDYFLYFEEFDLAQRVKKLGKQILFTADASITHIGQHSTSYVVSTPHFYRSRYRYLSKWYGTLGRVAARFVESFEQPGEPAPETLAVAMLVREADTPRPELIAQLNRFADAVYLLSDGASKTWEALARKHDWKYQVRRLEGDFAAQRNFLLDSVTEDWTIFLDSDELPSNAWWSELSQARKNWKFEALHTKRHDVFHGTIVRFGELGAQRLVRGARTALARGSWRRTVHETWSVPATRTVLLTTPLLHHSHDSLEDFWQSVTSYARFEPALSPKPHPLKMVVRMIVYPCAKFVQNYFWRQGWRDGFAGFAYAMMMSMYSLMKRVYEYEKAA